MALAVGVLAPTAAATPQGRNGLIACYMTTDAPVGGIDGLTLWDAAVPQTAAAERVAPLDRWATGSMDPSWHPAGDRLAWTYAPSDADGRRDVYLMSMAGKTFGSSVPVTRTRTVDERQPAFSPDGTTIAYTRGSLSSPEVWLVGADGRNPRRLLTSAYDPAWSPDGRKLAFARNREIYTVDVTGRNLRRITNDTDTDGDASWSPDGRRLVWASGAGSSRGSYLWTGSAAGGAPRQVTFELDAEGYEERNDDVTPVWSPDGTSIAFSRWNLMGGELWTTRADGTGATFVARLCLDPDWQRLP